MKSKKSQKPPTPAYRVGQLSEMMGVKDFDPILGSIFSSAITKNNKKKSVVVKSVERNEPALPIPPPKQPKPEKKNLLSHSQAADIRVGAKAKFHSTPTTQQQNNKKVYEPPQQKFEAFPFSRLNLSRNQKPPRNKFNKTKEVVKPKIIKVKVAPPTEAVEEEEPEVAEQVQEKYKKKRTNKGKAAETPGEDNIKKTIAEQNAPKEKDPELESRTLYVGNVPKDTTKKELHKIFSEFGHVQTIRFRCAAPDKPSRLFKVAINKKELHPDRNSLAAYIRYKTREEAEAAKKGASGMEVMDHHLTVDLADNSHKKDNKRAIFVGNLTLKLQDDELWNFFEECGKIESVRIVRDRNTGLGKGFGYVNFEDRASVESALNKEGSELRKRPIRITRCVKKVKKDSDQNASGGGGGGGGSRKKKISQGERQRVRGGEKFSGDKTAEIGTTKRESKKPNRIEMKKARIAKQLQPGGTPQTEGKKVKKSKPKHLKRKMQQQQSA